MCSLSNEIIGSTDSSDSIDIFISQYYGILKCFIYAAIYGVEILKPRLYFIKKTVIYDVI